MADWDDIKYFLAVARNGSVSAAAQQLNVNHTTVSRRIQALENAHQVTLFDRSSSGFKLSTSGQEVLSLAEEIESKHNHFLRSLYGKDQHISGTISITMPHDLYEWCLASPLSDFQRAHPEITLNISVAKGLKNLAAREADIAIRFTPEPPEFLIGKKITQLRYAIYGEDNPENNITPILCWEGEFALPEWAKTFKNPQIVARFDDLNAMYAAVKHGLGLARMPCYIVNCQPKDNINTLNIDAPQSNWSLWVLSHVDLRDTYRVKLCRQMLTDYLTTHQHLFNRVNK